MADKAQRVMLAEKHTEDIDPTGYWMSEKLDGVRAYWNGSSFYSRAGIRYHAPKFFTADLPKTPLDGELWCGRGLFEKCVSIVKKKDKNVIEEDWKFITYLVFDAPAHKAQYEERVKWLQTQIHSEKKTCYAAVVGIKKCTGQAHLDATMKGVLAKGGEGIMLRAARSNYEEGRSKVLLKVKAFYDEEARVIGYRAGEGRLTGLMGAIECELPNGVKFHIGTGFSDAQRKKPPKKGEVVTFKYQEVSKNGHPRFPVYLRIRGDLTWEDVCKNAKTKTPMSQIKKKVSVLGRQHTLLFSTVPSRDQAGDKIVTDQDVCSDDEDGAEILGNDLSSPVKSPLNDGKKVCKYGASCYQKNKQHLDQYYHEPKTTTTTNSNNNNNTSKNNANNTNNANNNNNAAASNKLTKNNAMDVEDTVILDAMANKKIIDDEDSDDENFYGSLEETMNLQDPDDGDDQALISAKDWSQLLRRLATLESKFAELSAAKVKSEPQSDKPLAKRTRSNSGTGEDWGTLATKKTKK